MPGAPAPPPCSAQPSDTAHSKPTAMGGGSSLNAVSRLHAQMLIYIMNCCPTCSWIMGAEERNPNCIRRTRSRKLLSNKYGKPGEKKSHSLRQRLPLYTGEEIQNTFVFMSASDPGQPLSGQERQTQGKCFFHNAPLVCQIRR